MLNYFLIALAVVIGTLVAWTLGLAFLAGLFGLTFLVTINPWVGYPLLIAALVGMGITIQWYTDRTLKIGG
jgi:hypothetical protein